MSPTPRRKPGRPRASGRDDTRERILVAARVCFAELGFAGTTNRAIGERAGVTAAAIYNYFASKVALYVAAVRAAEAEILPRYRAAVTGAPSARAALQALVAESAAAHAADPTLTAFLSALPIEMKRHPEIEEAMGQPDEIVALIAGIVDRGQESGELTSELPLEAIVSMIVACMMGLSLAAATVDVDGAAGALAAFEGLLGGALFSRS